MVFARPLAQLISQFERLPGVGPKSAQRLAFHVLRMTDEDVKLFADSMLEAKKSLKLCSVCQNISEDEVCSLCNSPQRSMKEICVVGDAKDISSLERLNEYKGSYHVLHGLINPVEQIGPEQLKVKELLNRLTDDVEEVIIATNPTIEGDATALYLARLIKPLQIKVTRLAHGMPVGGELDFADSATLLSALEYRREL